MLKAVTRQASHVDAKIASINASSGKPKISTAYFFDHYASKEDVAVMVTEEDFVSAERELVPSVSLKELEHYKRVRAQFDKPEEESGETNGKGQSHSIENAAWAGRPRSNGKGKGKAIDKKGKGKALEAWQEEDGEDVYSGGGMNGASKGKGKAKATEGFIEASADDDEGLY